MKRVRKSKTIKHPKQKTIREPNTGLKLTGIPDLEYNRGKIGVDIKFGESVAEWERRIFNRQYAMWMQAAMYGIIYGYKEFYFFCTQSKGHTYSQAFHIDAQSMEVLKDHLIENVLRKFRRQLGIGFFKDAEEVEIPDWMLYTAA